MLKKRSLSVLVLIATLVVMVAPMGLTTAQGDPVTIQWFVGLGAGGQPEQLEAQQAVVDEFNATHDNIELEIIIADNDVAYDTLSTLIASGDAPDIVGPVGIRGSNAYTGSWLDLDPLLESTGVDISMWDPALVDFYRVEGEGLIGLPFGVFPATLWYNRDLFDEAGLDYPPHQYGEPYADGDPWTLEKMQELALLLTVDENGNDATMEEFDPEAVVQFGFANQWINEARAMFTTPFGAASFVDEEGNAQIPDNWREAAHWYYDAIWTDSFYPSDPYVQSDSFGNGNVFASGNVAMAFTHLWYTCCVGEVNFDMAAIPSYNDEVTAKLHADTFRILSSTEHPEEAFEVLYYLLTDAAPTLLAVYGGLPADEALQADFLAGLDEQFPQGVDWQVAIDSLAYPDNPSHESNMPNFNRADERIVAFYTGLIASADFDVDAELESLQADLQAIFDEAGE